MNAVLPAKTGAPKGYLSDDAKRKFTITTGILGAVFFFGQMIVPFVIMMVLMPMSMFFNGPLFRFADVARGTFWNGRVWCVERSESPKRTPESSTALASFALGAQEEPEKAAFLPPEDAWLLPGDDRLWIISSGAVRSYDEGQISTVTPRETLGDISRPFMYDGHPAVIEERPPGQALRVFIDGEWQRRASFRLSTDEAGAPVLRHLQAVTSPGKLSLFFRFGDTLYYRETLPIQEEDDWQSWEPVSKVEDNWVAVSLAGEPAVFRCTAEDMNAMIVGLKRAGNMWEPFFTHSTGFVARMGVYPLGGPGEFVLVRETFPGSIRAIEVKDGEVVREMKYGDGFPFPFPFAIMFVPYGCMLIMPLVLAFILSVQMRKYRVCEHVAGTAKVPFAPLSRRALAQVIDSIFLGAPIIVGSIILASTFADMEDMLLFSLWRMFAMFGLFFGGILWALIGLLIFSCLEGSLGWTPGKWVMGIRVVGTDLRPCGFGRALVRNLLKFVDGFFNFMVGILLVALTDNWQRLGDLAARTVVIRAGEGSLLGKAPPFVPPEEIQIER